MEYSPPPLFKQGASARVKVIVFSMIAVALLIVDSRMHALTTIRQAVGIALYPIQAAALMPRDAAYAVGDYFSTLSRFKAENEGLKRQQTLNAQQLQQGQQLQAENMHLRKLLGAGERLPSKPVMAEILYDARDAFTRKVIVDRGAQHKVEPGQPVIDDTGVVGQVTRVFPFTSEVTLLTDKDQAIPVQVVRSGLRSIAYGQGHSGSLDLRFMPVNADIKNGDVLVTSGIDGVYPAGLAVAKVAQVESKSSDAFARIVCQPLAGIDRNRQLLILLNEKNDMAMRAPSEGKISQGQEAAGPAKPTIGLVKHVPAEKGTAQPAQQPNQQLNEQLNQQPAPSGDKEPVRPQVQAQAQAKTPPGPTGSASVSVPARTPSASADSTRPASVPAQPAPAIQAQRLPRAVEPAHGKAGSEPKKDSVSPSVESKVAAP